MDLAFWRDIAIVFLALQTVILLVVIMIPFYFIVRGLNFAHTRLPRLLFRAQDYSRQMRGQTERVSEKVGAPLLRSQREFTKAETVVRELTPGVQTKGTQRKQSQ